MKFLVTVWHVCGRYEYKAPATSINFTGRGGGQFFSWEETWDTVGGGSSGRPPLCRGSVTGVRPATDEQTKRQTTDGQRRLINVFICKNQVVKI